MHNTNKNIFITNKFDIMMNCSKCDKEGLLSNCCNHEIKFNAVGAPKCNKCKRFCKLIPCDQCKEEIQYNKQDQEELGKLTPKEILFIMFIIIAMVSLAYLLLT